MYWNNKKIKIKEISKKKTTEYNKLNKKKINPKSLLYLLLFALIRFYLLIFAYFRYFLKKCKRTSKTTLYECKRNEQDHPIRTQEKKNKWTTYKNTKNLYNTIYKNTKRHVKSLQNTTNQHERIQTDLNGCTSATLSSSLFELFHKNTNDTS